MIKKLTIHLWNSRDQLLRYFVTGFSAFCLDMGTLYILVDIFGLDSVLSVAINQVVIIFYIFILNKFWSFKAEGDTRKQIIRFFIVMAFNYLVAVIWMWFWNKHLGYDAKLTRVANIILSTSWNFLMYKHFVYKVTSQKQEVINQ
jgi:putative flippase GtrA